MRHFHIATTQPYTMSILLFLAKEPFYEKGLRKTKQQGIIMFMADLVLFFFFFFIFSCSVFPSKSRKRGFRFQTFLEGFCWCPWLISLAPSNFRIQFSLHKLDNQPRLSLQLCILHLTTFMQHKLYSFVLHMDSGILLL